MLHSDTGLLILAEIQKKINSAGPVHVWTERSSESISMPLTIRVFDTYGMGIECIYAYPMAMDPVSTTPECCLMFSLY